MTDNITEDKASLRRRAYDARNAQDNKNVVSNLITQKIVSLSVYQQAQTVMWYLHCRSEVRTLTSVTREIDLEKRLVIPYCTEDQWGAKQLGLWHLSDLDELVPGTWDILEPPESRWQEHEKNLAPEAPDLVLVPGVAFAKNGARLGNGQGYYDNLLRKVRDDCVLVGVGYQCQIFDQVPMDDHDIYLDYVITEQSFYQGIGRKR